MRDLISEISNDELAMFNEYVTRNALNIGEEDDERYQSNYGFDHEVPVEKKLAYWSAAKQDLFHLLGNKLILEKEVEVTRAEWELSSEIEEKLLDHPFISFVNKANHDGRIISNLESLQHRGWTYWGSYLFHDMCCDRSYCISYNSWGSSDFVFYVKDYRTEEYKKIKVQSGSKPIKIFSRVAKYLGCECEYEDFRLKHSMILNDRHMKGILCLSIHPMDYLTMSDNGYDWDSCMSWIQGGCYKRGTVEMMNSPWVIVAYLKGKQDFHPNTDTKTWSNKKWRTLIIANADFITSIKSYPYRHDELTQKIVSWVKELAEYNWGVSYEENLSSFEDNFYERELSDYSIHFSTDTMYNDFGCDTRHYITLRKDFVNPLAEKVNSFVQYGKNWYVYNYSGVDNCMCCGHEVNHHYYSSSDVYCENCSDSVPASEYIDDCIYCHEGIYDNEDYVCVNGDECTLAHENCAYDKVELCDCCGEYYEKENIFSASLTYKGHKISRKKGYFDATLIPLTISLCIGCRADVADAYIADAIDPSITTFELTNLTDQDYDLGNCFSRACANRTPYLDTKDENLVNEANDFVTKTLDIKLKTNWRDIRLQSIASYNNKTDFDPCF